MTLPRAYVNCRRCYELASAIDPGQDKTIRIINDDQVYTARNEAMRALEHVLDITATEQDLSPTRSIAQEILANKGLEACMNCDYSQPKIADLVKPKDNTKK